MDEDETTGTGFPGAAVQCPECNAYSEVTDRYCACCGVPLHDLCPACQAIVLDPVANYCTQCGGRLKGPEGIATERAAAPARDDAIININHRRRFRRGADGYGE